MRKRKRGHGKKRGESDNFEKKEKERKKEKKKERKKEERIEATTSLTDQLPLRAS